MTISFGSGGGVLGILRHLSATNSDLSRSLDRLSSGMRITRASDDAAGLAVASSLNTGARVYSQAIRNSNDAISLVNIADGALNQMSTLGVRLQELAEQAANGTYSASQRARLHEEAQQLVEEYNRVVGSTSFNGRPVVGQTERINFQLGFGSNEILGNTFNQRIARTVGNASYSSVTSSNSALQGVGDFDRDGKADLVSYSGASLRILKGNGDGTFGSTLYSIGALTYTHGTGGDFDGDGRPDFFGQQGGFYTFSLNQSGGFVTRNNVGTVSAVLEAGNMSGGAADELLYVSGSNLVISNTNSGLALTQISSTALGTATASDLALADVNGDGNTDVLVSDSASNSVRVYTNDGNGSLSLASTFSAGTGGGLTQIQIADTNFDGYLDAVTSGSGGTRVNLGNGDGSFSETSTVIGSQVTNLRSADVNSDGVMDLLGQSGTTLYQFVNDGRGGFTESTIGTITSGAIYAGDLNGDGVSDIVTQGSSLLNNTTQSGLIAHLDLSTAVKARTALDSIQSLLDRIGKERGELGAFQSRLDSALGTLQTKREGYLAAAARITDADIAQESANLVRSQILREVTASVLAQANQQPALALRLLSER